MNRKSRDDFIIACMACWLVVTTFTQHPNRSFDRLRDFDRYTLTIPNWRFFAPHPATNDYILGVRVRLADESQPTNWEMVNSYEPRRIGQMLFFPGRRGEKALADICGRVLGVISNSPQRLSSSPDYKLLVEHARSYVLKKYGDRAERFQFLLGSDAGFDQHEKLNEYYVSPGIKLEWK